MGCWQRPTYKGGVGRDTDNVFGGVSRDTQYKGGISRDTNNSSRAQGNFWIRLGNDGATRRLLAGTCKWLSTVHN
jgi:hypothetical protein